MKYSVLESKVIKLTDEFHVCTLQLCIIDREIHCSNLRSSQVVVVVGVWCGVVWCGVVWCGAVWCGVVWRDVAWCGVWRVAASQRS